MFSELYETLPLPREMLAYVGWVLGESEGARHKTMQDGQAYHWSDKGGPVYNSYCAGNLSLAKNIVSVKPFFFDDKFFVCTGMGGCLESHSFEFSEVVPVDVFESRYPGYFYGSSVEVTEAAWKRGHVGDESCDCDDSIVGCDGWCVQRNWPFSGYHGVRVNCKRADVLSWFHTKELVICGQSLAASIDNEAAVVAATAPSQMELF